MPDERFTVLFVCTGNICRSRMAEAIARQWLDTALGDEAEAFTLVSVGTHALVGEPVEATTLRVLAERGVDVQAGSGRQVTRDLVRGADLVLTAERVHRCAAVRLVPSAERYTFTLRELARRASAVGPADLPDDGAVARARALVGACGERRTRVPSDDGYADDISDPYSGHVETFRECAQTIEQALDVPLSLLSR